MLGSLGLSVGMTEEQFNARVGQDYFVTRNGDSRTVALKARADGTHEILATVSFQKGRISSIIKSWVSEQHDIESFWRGMYGSISGVAGSQETAATVTTRSNLQPGGSYHSVELTIKGRTIIVSRSEWESDKLIFYDVGEEFD
jgi:hypothetical protein